MPTGLPLTTPVWVQVTVTSVCQSVSGLQALAALPIAARVFGPFGLQVCS
jgi:hypothetical protein